MEYFLISLGGILGANTRYVLASWAARQFGLGFPYGTFIINLSGSFLLGVFTGFMLKNPDSHYPRLFFAVGFLGAYTTFSTFSLEALQLLQTGRVLAVLVYIIGSAVLGVLGAGLGFSFGRSL